MKTCSAYPRFWEPFKAHHNNWQGGLHIWAITWWTTLGLKDHDSWCFPFQFLEIQLYINSIIFSHTYWWKKKRFKYKPKSIQCIRKQKQACVKQALAKRKWKWYMIEDANWEKGFQKNFAQFCFQGNTSFFIRHVKNVIYISTWDMERTIHGSALWNVK